MWQQTMVSMLNAFLEGILTAAAGVQTAAQTDVLYGYTSTIRSHVVISALVKLNDIITLAFINIVIALQQDCSDTCMVNEIKVQGKLQILNKNVQLGTMSITNNLDEINRT
uniref:Uncharacterized protein n=1 Tax=Glossina austeni TaxID=7395 RepID=A0A1A9UH57_GLOAU